MDRTLEEQERGIALLEEAVELLKAMAQAGSGLVKLFTLSF